MAPPNQRCPCWPAVITPLDEEKIKNTTPAKNPAVPIHPAINIKPPKRPWRLEPPITLLDDGVMLFQGIAVAK
jgi:hypothetical protein